MPAPGENTSLLPGESLGERRFDTEGEVVAVARMAEAEGDEQLKAAADRVLDAMDGFAGFVNTTGHPHSHPRPREAAADPLATAREELARSIRAREARLFGGSATHHTPDVDPRADTGGKGGKSGRAEELTEAVARLRAVAGAPGSFISPVVVQERVVDVLASAEAAGVATGAEPDDIRLARRLNEGEARMVRDAYIGKDVADETVRLRAEVPGGKVLGLEERLMRALARFDPRLAEQVDRRQQRSLRSREGMRPENQRLIELYRRVRHADLAPLTLPPWQSLRDQRYDTKETVRVVVALARNEARRLRARPLGRPERVTDADAFEKAAIGVLDALDGAAAAVYSGAGALSRPAAEKLLADATASLSRHVRLREAHLFGNPAEVESVRKLNALSELRAQGVEPSAEAEDKGDRAATFIADLEELREAATDSGAFYPPAPVQAKVAAVLASAKAAGFDTKVRADDIRLAEYLMDAERAVLVGGSAATGDADSAMGRASGASPLPIEYSGVEVVVAEKRLMAALVRLDLRLAERVAERQQRSLAPVVVPDGASFDGPLSPNDRRLAVRYRQVRDPRRAGTHRSYHAEIGPGRSASSLTATTPGTTPVTASPGRVGRARSAGAAESRRRVP